MKLAGILVVLLLSFNAFADGEGTGSGSNSFTGANPAVVDMPIGSAGNPYQDRTENDNTHPSELSTKRSGSWAGEVARTYKGCYTTYPTVRQAQKNCPPGAIAVAVYGNYNGFTCQCSISTDGGN